METWAHRAVGVAAVLAVAHYPVGPHLPWWALSAATAAAAVTSGGWTSPDVDNQGMAKAADRLLPDEILGGGGPLGHRQLAHSVTLPVAALAAWWLYVPAVPLLVVALAWGAWLGWVSHLVGDAVFGMAGIGHRKGVPLLLWWGHVGVGLRADGVIEKVVGGLSYAVAVFAGVTLVGPLAHYWPGGAL